MTRPKRRWPGEWAAHVFLAVLWLLHWLPLAWQATVGRGLGALLWRLAGSRRRIALRNLALCFPDRPEAERVALAREHFAWLARSFLERGLLWHASPARLKRLIHVEGEVDLAERSERPVMWLVPHFLALDVAGAATQLFQRRWVVSIYQTQTNAAMDSAIRRGRLRYGNGELFSRSEGAKPVIRAVRQGHAFLNLPDMDFGARDATFVPFFGVPAATLLAPSRMAKALGMVVQPVVAEMLPGGQGYRVRFLPPLENFPTDNAVQDAARMNAWIETEILRNPAQYLWVHKRFKTRPPGEASVY
ncbi:MAG: lipid A biosynthesis acyltransferase [Burkholderiales bacterium]